MAEEESSSLNFSLIIAVVLSVVLATGLSYFMMIKFGGLTANGEKASSQSQEKKNEVQELGPTHTLGQFLVNLSGSTSYVKVKVSFEVDKQQVITEIQNRTPQIRDRIISILRSKPMKEINSNQGAKELRTQIRNGVNEYLAKGKVTNVFFTEFVVQ